MHKQERERSRVPLDELAAQHRGKAREILEGADGNAVRDEITRFADTITSAREGFEQDGAVKRLLDAIVLRKSGLWDEIPPDKKERAAFALALVRAHKEGVQ